jgi:thioesterase domain-containing protein
VSVAAFLSELRRHDIRVWVEGETLRCNAPAGALTEELREQLRQRKRDIVSFLHMAQASSARSDAIFPLQRNGSRPPVFGVPGAGDIFCFRPLAQALGADQPFFGLQAPGLDGRGEPLERVEDLAAYFAEQIRAFHPQGPWIIAGKCIGGTVALELARQLAARGGACAFVALFGAAYPTFFRPLSLLRHRIEDRVGLWRRRIDILASQSAKERLQYVLWRLRRARQAPDPAAALHAKVLAATVRAVRAYEPRPFPGRVHHYLPCESWARRPHVRAERWRALAGMLETYCGPEGCTEDDMLLEEHAPLFAQHFRLSCAQAGL